MPKNTFTPEQIVGKLRQIEVLMSQRWRRECGGLQLEHAKKQKDLQKENAQLKRLWPH
jgi:hypothetical protein